jgi:hypothetical protein
MRRERERESANKEIERECVCANKERERESVCVPTKREREKVCVPTKRVTVTTKRERGTVPRERERKREREERVESAKRERTIAHRRTLMVSRGCPLTTCRIPPQVPANRSFATNSVCSSCIDSSSTSWSPSQPAVSRDTSSPC